LHQSPVSIFPRNGSCSIRLGDTLGIQCRPAARPVGRVYIVLLTSIRRQAFWLSAEAPIDRPSRRLLQGGRPAPIRIVPALASHPWFLLPIRALTKPPATALPCLIRPLQEFRSPSDRCVPWPHIDANQVGRDRWVCRNVEAAAPQQPGDQQMPPPAWVRAENDAAVPFELVNGPIGSGAHASAVCG